MHRSLCSLFLLISLCASSAVGQPGEWKPFVPRDGGTPEVGQTQEPTRSFTNADVIGMVKAGRHESEISAAIRANPTKFDLSADALIALRKAGVSNKILEAMIERERTGTILPRAGGGVNGGAKSDRLSPQPLPPKAGISDRAPSAEQQLKAELAKARVLGKTIQGTKNQRTVQANDVAIGLLKRQRQAADIESAHMKLGGRSQAPATMLGQQSQLMSASGRATTSPMIQAPAGGGVAHGNGSRTQADSKVSRATAAALAMVQQAPSTGSIGPNETLSAPGTIASAIPSQGTSAPQPVSSSNSSNASGGSAGKISASVAQLHPNEFAPEIVKLTPAQNTCRLVGATQGKEDARSHDAADWEIYSSFVEDPVSVSLQKTATGQYEMSPQSALLPGEYAVVLRPISRSEKFSGGDVARAQGPGLLFDTVWSFQIASDAQ
jgi:hypothetical protein